MTRRLLYVVREHPEQALDELVAVAEEDVPSGAVEIVRELGDAQGTRYLHALLRRPVPEWDRRWRVLTHEEDAPFAAELIRHRVVAYVTRERGGETQLLTIRVEDWPEPFLEVPAGRLEHGESLEDGLMRELAEETGFSGARVVRELPDFECTYRTYSHNHAFHLEATEETPDEWRHQVHGDGADAGLLHSCRWVPLTSGLKLWNEGDPMLRNLPIGRA